MDSLRITNGTAGIRLVTEPDADRQASQRARTPTPDHQQDSVQFSGQASELASQESLSNVRLDRINRIRDEIARGVFESPDKINATIDKVLSEINRIDFHA